MGGEWIVLGAIALLVGVGAPLFAIVGVLTALCLLLFTGHSQFIDLKVLIQHMENLATKQEFLAIPLFMASGAVMTASGIAGRLVDLMKALLGWLPGGMAVAAVAACMFFAAISGSSPVTLIAVGSMMVPALIRGGYPENFSIGLITTAGSLGCLVPPSMSMLIYAISVSGAQSVDPSDLFLAGLVPAFLVAGLLALYSIATGLRLGGKREPFRWSELREKFVDGVWAVFLPVLVLGGIYGGWYTPSQAGAVALIYSLWLALWVYRDLNLRQVLASFMESGALMGALLPIIVLAFGLNEFLALIEVQDKLMDFLRETQPSAAQFMLIVNVVLIVLGALMDSISATLIFAPMLAPVAAQLYGIDPLHFGVVFVVNMEIGYLMPPVATNLFVASAVFKKPFGQVTRAVLPTLAITCVALLLVIYLPTLSLGALNWKNDRPISSAFPWSGPPAAVPRSSGESEAPMGLKGLTGKMLDDMDEDEAPSAQE
jgi:C4-dicarboxylate transporter DctM subunit